MIVYNVDRANALKWWNDLPVDERIMFCNISFSYPRAFYTLTTREIEKIYLEHQKKNNQQ